jgi:hypothetical protein
MSTRKLAKPVYKRQQFLLSFLKELNEPLTSIDFQKLLFLYINKNNLNYYDFVPYLYGGYSFQAGEDISTLEAMGWLTFTNEKIQYADETSIINKNLPFGEFGISISDQLPKARGNDLVRLVYNQYPYYAINSRTASSIMDTEGMTRIKAEKERLKQTKQMLFTIGYEGISVERYINNLIQNDVHVLCDVRNNSLSRKFGFSKNSLQKYLGNIGIEYIHLPELGIKSEKRNNLISDEDYQNLFKEYKTSLPTKGNYIEKLYQLIKNKRRIALTCFEHEPLHCHRHVIRDYLIENYKVEAADL